MTLAPTTTNAPPQTIEEISLINLNFDIMVTSMNKYNNFGLKYKTARKEKGISQEEASKNVTSRARLSRWERGEVTMPFELVLQLLKNINMSYADFMRDDSEKESHFLARVQDLYIDNKTAELKEWAKDLLAQYHQNTNHREILKKAAIIANFYLDLTNENLLAISDAREIELQLEKIETWYDNDIIYFGNVQLLLNPISVYHLSRNINSSIYDRKNEVNIEYVFNALINAACVLIKSKLVRQAQEVVKISRKLELLGYHLLESYRLKYVEGLLAYAQTKEDKKLQTLFSKLAVLPSFDQLLSDFKFGFSQIKEIYAI
ncbi:hypothetical protein GCM10019817_03680 [Lactobacillus intestinalis]